jgi:hypothetical protein
LTIASVLPYLRDIIKGATKPNIVSWITWSLLTGIATAAQISAHEYFAAIFTASATLATTAVVALGVRHGYVKYTMFDVVCQISAIIGIILWQLFDSPTLGVLASVVIDLIGALPTVRHAWQKPGEETWQTFAVASVGGLFGLLALSTFNWITLPYATYILIANIFLTSEIIYRRRQLR